MRSTIKYRNIADSCWQRGQRAKERQQRLQTRVAGIELKIQVLLDELARLKQP